MRVLCLLLPKQLNSDIILSPTLLGRLMLSLGLALLGF